MDHELIKFSGLTSAIIIGLIIGLRHSTDGDHIIAISTLAKEYKNSIKHYNEEVSLPIYPNLNLKKIYFVIKKLKEFLY